MDSPLLFFGPLGDPMMHQQDPSKFPIAVKVTDDRALLLETEVRDIAREIETWQRQLLETQSIIDRLTRKLNYKNDCFCERLEQAYPEVKNNFQNLGFREKGHSIFYVGWGEK